MININISFLIFSTDWCFFSVSLLFPSPFFSSLPPPHSAPYTHTHISATSNTHFVFTAQFTLDLGQSRWQVASPGELSPQAMKGNAHAQIRWTYELLTESHFGKVNCVFFFLNLESFSHKEVIQET